MSETFKDPEKVGFITGATHGSSTSKNWWQYARDTRNVARNARINLPTEAELTAFKSFIDVIVKWDSGTGTFIGTRPWLALKMNLKAISEATDYVGDTAVEPAYILVKYVEQISRDFKKIPVNDVEVAAVDALIASTGVRKLGTGPTFGNVAGDQPTV